VCRMGQISTSVLCPDTTFQFNVAFDATSGDPCACVRRSSTSTPVADYAWAARCAPLQPLGAPHSTPLLERPSRAHVGPTRGHRQPVVLVRPPSLQWRPAPCFATLRPPGQVRRRRRGPRQDQTGSSGICGTTHETVKRITETHEAEQSPGLPSGQVPRRTLATRSQDRSADGFGDQLRLSLVLGGDPPHLQAQGHDDEVGQQ
jgi:hypothetical protein